MLKSRRRFELLDRVLSLAEILFIPMQRLLGTQRMAYLFILPNLLIFGIFVLLPMQINFYYSFTSGDSFLPENRNFTGMQNLERLMTCEDYARYQTCLEDGFWRAARNTFGYVGFEVTLIVLASLTTALALNQRIRGRGFFRSVFFYPVLLSPVVVALIWKWILQENGALNGLLLALGGEEIKFLSDSNWTIFWVIVVGVWAQMGFYTLILLAGLQSIPSELYEAAAIDGANAWDRFKGVTLPMLRPVMAVVLVLSLIRAVQVFDQVFVLSSGGPGTATLYMVQYIYQTAFVDNKYGVAAAASLILAVALLFLTLAQLYVRRRNEEAYG